MDGITMLQELRERNDHRPVIVVTGHADIALAVEAIGSGAFDFVENHLRPKFCLEWCVPHSIPNSEVQ